MLSKFFGILFQPIQLHRFGIPTNVKRHDIPERNLVIFLDLDPISPPH